MELIQPEYFLSEVEIFEKRFQIVPDRFNEVVIDFFRDVVVEQGGTAAICKISNPRIKKVFFY